MGSQVFTSERRRQGNGGQRQGRRGKGGAMAALKMKRGNPKQGMQAASPSRTKQGNRRSLQKEHSPVNTLILAQ